MVFTVAFAVGSFAASSTAANSAAAIVFLDELNTTCFLWFSSDYGR
jgi:hypothetical protein